MSTMLIASPDREHRDVQTRRLSVRGFQVETANLIERPLPDATIERERSLPESRGVLIADDDPFMRHVLGTYLSLEGFRVWTASNGEEALDHCCDHGEEIGIALLDFRPDGRETMSGLHAFNPELPVCFMTGDPGASEFDDLLAHGAKHVFGKPFRLDDMVRVVRRLVGGSTGESGNVDIARSTWKSSTKLSFD